MSEHPVPNAQTLEPADRPGLCRFADSLPAGTADPVLIQVLEALNSQSQLLIDLLAAVNGLTSALLCRER